MGNKLKEYLFGWLLENDTSDIIIMVNTAKEGVTFSFSLPSNIVGLKVKYAKDLFIDSTGISCTVSFNPSGNFPNEEYCIFPWTCVLGISSSNDLYAFSFADNSSLVDEEVESKPRPNLKLC